MNSKSIIIKGTADIHADLDENTLNFQKIDVLLLSFYNAPFEN